jgi:predicted aldo/keto reductase-like oxidoreductase
MAEYDMNRRRFLQTGAFAAVTPVLAATADEEKKEDEKKILNHNSEMKYRRLGDTDAYFSVISFGGLVAEESVFNYGIERGVNLLHTATNYHGGESIKTLAKVLKTRRDQVYVAVKDTFDDIDEVLKILDTDYIDFYMIAKHAEKEMQDPALFEAAEKYIKQGKVRWVGLTTHREVKECVNAALDMDGFELIMPVLNQPSLESLTEELRKAEEKKKGIMAMKSMKGIEDAELELAYLKKLLKNPAVTTVTKGIGTFEKLDSYIKAMNETLTGAEDMSLYRYAQSNRSRNCMMCAECESVCPQKMAICTILRCNDYYADQQQDMRTALETYSAIPERNRNSCTSCGTCQTRCPNGIDIVDRLGKAVRRFEPYVA